MMVRMAATVVALNSRPERQYQPMVIEHVMDDGQHRAHGKRELVADGHIDQDAEQGKQARDHGRLLDFLADGGADVVLAQLGEVARRASSVTTATTLSPVPVAESTRRVSRPLPRSV